jgi:signal transduction histidine kinase
MASNLLADLAQSYALALLYSKSAIIWAALMPLLFNELINQLYFINDTRYQKIHRRMFLFSVAITSLIILLSPTALNIKSLTLQPWGADYVPGSLYYLLFIYLILSFGFCFYNLYKVYKNYSNPAKSQARLILMGSLLTLFLVIYTNIIGPILGNSSVSLFGPPTIIFFIGFIAYAITKHNLFNIKVIATELITFSLWVFILVRTLIAKDLQSMLIEGGLLVVTLIVGSLLIKSVIKEVTQREKIELLAADLQKANDRLRELDRQKSEFVSFATHQLRAPLTAMKGYASLILEGDLGKLSHEMRSAITRIYDSSNTLANIVDDYLNISRIELGSMKYSFETVDLKDLIDNVIGELRPNIEKSHLKFDINVDRDRRFMVNVDRDKFKQIIANLVDNSMKYTPTGTVTVALEKKKAVGEGAPKILFSVKDNGIGIAPEVLPLLFAKFTRAENGSRQNIHGTGLGLFVAKQIVEAHHGRIWAESRGEGKGSAFFVELDEVS